MKETTNYDFAKVLKAIAHQVPCDKCPYPCEKKYIASQASCDRHWYEMLSSVKDTTWDEILYKLI